MSFPCVSSQTRSGAAPSLSVMLWMGLLEAMLAHRFRSEAREKNLGWDVAISQRENTTAIGGFRKGRSETLPYRVPVERMTRRPTEP